MCTCRPSSTRENLWAPVIWPARAAPGLRSTLPVEEVRGPVRAVYIHDENSKLTFMYKDKITAYYDKPIFFFQLVIFFLDLRLTLIFFFFYRAIVRLNYLKI